MKKLSGFLQFTIGLLLAIAFLLGGGIAAALYLAAKHSTQPERPVFDEERVATQPAAGNAKSASTQPKAATLAASTSTPANTSKPLEPGAYRARVIWPQGLLLRDSPGFNANSLGGVPFNAQVVVLEESSDKEWQQVRLENSDQKGWIKGGNIERINE
ncbi:SH3 domain-containing protein [Microcoleus sp. FACHB-672]|uniref:SH3 domain-containing protein n=1 Tax=Microcoleus sp. FACHB-672 TaxID=2692825 RepID=UPI00168540BE|nr:SH3 domain-containing protein [Microcoleus sp. FACHB-672]MBD2040267.1 SH3 domain-containing protein [Microcoleus sp. FACHB-672]